MKIKFLILAVLLGFSTIAQNINYKKDIKDNSTKPKLMKKAPKKVFIRSFKLYFQMIAEGKTSKRGGRQLGGGSYKGKATARLAVGVKGVSVAGLQELTNKMYAYYLKRLQDEGLEVFTAADLPKIKYFEGWEIINGPHVNEAQLKGYLMVVPEGFNYFVKKVTGKGKEKIGGVYQDKAYKISKQLNDMIVADVELFIPSIWLNASSSMLANLGGAKVKGGPNLRLAAASFIKYQSGQFKINAWPETSAILTLKNDIPIEGVFAQQKFKAVATQQRTTIPDYAAFFTVENVKVSITRYISCDEKTYVDKVGKAMQNYMDLTFNKLSNSLKGNK